MDTIYKRKESRSIIEENLPLIDRMTEEKGIIFECKDLEWGF